MIRKSRFERRVSLTPVIVMMLFLAACNGKSTNTAPSTTESPTTSSAPAPAKTGFEGDLDYIRKGGYTYIWVFSRKDGKPIDKDDAAFLRTNAPQVVDWVTTDEGRKVIAGTNFDLAEGNLGLIMKRFNAEDYTGR